MLKNRTIAGYTLIELLVVVSLTALLSVGVVGLFVTLLRGGGKASALARVKEEGDFALITMERLIRNAGSIESSSCNGTGTAENFIVLNSFETPTDTTKIEKESSTGRLKITDTVSSIDTVRYMTSSDVHISGDPFRCYPGTGSSGDRVDIEFVIEDAVDSHAVETFSTSVTLRNF